MKEDKSLFGIVKRIFQFKEEGTEKTRDWNSKDWIEIKARDDYEPQSKLSNSTINRSKSMPSNSLRGPAVPLKVNQVRPLTKDRIISEKTTHTERDSLKPVGRMSADELKKKWPGAFDQK